MVFPLGRVRLESEPVAERQVALTVDNSDGQCPAPPGCARRPRQPTDSTFPRPRPSRRPWMVWGPRIDPCLYHPNVARALAVGAAIYMLHYLWWRATSTLNPAALVVSVPLIL